MREGHNARALTPLDIRITDDNPTGIITTFSPPKAMQSSSTPEAILAFSPD
ncbi:hypothetical protein [Corynebacterium cystitidis]|uniref:hypothetical protein n=1 Tax=Corynebacterium cystitidis TaxID=35757 RepID=UPI00211DD105|nr:hypothetical protein [Corynebacterium cystitidis]